MARTTDAVKARRWVDNNGSAAGICAAGVGQAVGGGCGRDPNSGGAEAWDGVKGAEGNDGVQRGLITSLESRSVLPPASFEEVMESEAETDRGAQRKHN